MRRRAHSGRDPSRADGPDRPGEDPTGASVQRLLTALIQEISPWASVVACEETPDRHYAVRLEVAGRVGGVVEIPKVFVENARRDTQALKTVQNLLRSEVLLLRHRRS